MTYVNKQQWLSNLDIRAPVEGFTLSRQMTDYGFEVALHHVHRKQHSNSTQGIAAGADEQVVQDAVSEHLAEGVRAKMPTGIYYIARVLSNAPVSSEWRNSYPATVVTWRQGRRVDCSLAELLAMDELDFAAWDIPYHPFDTPAPPMKCHPREVPSQVPIVAWNDVPSFGDNATTERINSMNLVGIKRIEDLYLLRFAAKRSDMNFHRGDPGLPSWFAPFAEIEADVLHVLDVRPDSKALQIFNAGSPLGKWLLGLRPPATDRPSPVDPTLCAAMFETCLKNQFEGYKLMQKWADNASIPDAAKPPRDGNGELLSGRDILLCSRRTVKK